MKDWEVILILFEPDLEQQRCVIESLNNDIYCKVTVLQVIYLIAKDYTLPAICKCWKWQILFNNL